MNGRSDEHLPSNLRFAAVLHKWLRRFSLIPGASHLISRLPFLRLVFRILLTRLPERAAVSGSSITWEGPEDYAFMAQKTIASFKAVIDHPVQYSHFLRTNNSSVWDFRALYNFVSTLGDDRIYAGVIGRFGKIEFASGAGILMDRASAKSLVNASPDLAYQFVDDVTIGEFFGRDKTQILSKLDRQDAPFREGFVLDAFHFRCKEGDKTVENMEMVARLISNDGSARPD
jgi:hypothetical protein